MVSATATASAIPKARSVPAAIVGGIMVMVSVVDATDSVAILSPTRSLVAGAVVLLSATGAMSANAPSSPDLARKEPPTST